MLYVTDKAALPSVHAFSSAYNTSSDHESDFSAAEWLSNFNDATISLNRLKWQQIDLHLHTLSNVSWLIVRDYFITSLLIIYCVR